jgi:hypothetical protein
MPVINIGGGTIASTITSDITEIKINKSFPGKITTTATTNIGAVGRTRSLILEPAIITSGIAGTLKRKIGMPGVIATTSRSEIQYFLEASPTPPPKGQLLKADISVFLDKKAKPPLFAGSRLIKGDLIPLSFKIQGQKLAGLNASFMATSKDGLLTITKSSIYEAAPTLDGLTTVETMTGSFSIDPADTASFPDSEVEMSYKLVFSDSLGRYYTVEKGNFTVYS